MKIELDKQLHIEVSIVLVFLIWLLTGNVLISAVLTFTIGVFKEIFDIGSTGFDIKDLLADLVGIGLGVGLISLVCLLSKTIGG